MDVIYKVHLNIRESDKTFPKLQRFFKREIVESGMNNSNLALVKWLNLPYEEGICYTIGVIKEEK